MFICSTDLNRDEVMKKFRDSLVDARPIYPMPLYEQEAFKDFSKDVNCPNAKALTQKCFHLPVHQHLAPNEIKHICKKIKEIGE
jgi:dTDP-4-amino-4,6-dideoxygalactose transaminase